MHVEQTAELATDFAQLTDVNETATLIQVQTGFASLGHARDQAMTLKTTSFRDNCFLEGVPELLCTNGEKTL